MGNLVRYDSLTNAVLAEGDDPLSDRIVTPGLAWFQVSPVPGLSVSVSRSNSDNYDPLIDELLNIWRQGARYVVEEFLHLLGVASIADSRHELTCNTHAGRIAEKPPLLANNPSRQLPNMSPSGPGQFAGLHDPSPRPRLCPFVLAAESLDIDVWPSSESLKEFGHFG